MKRHRARPPVRCMRCQPASRHHRRDRAVHRLHGSGPHCRQKCRRHRATGLRSVCRPHPGGSDEIFGLGELPPPGQSRWDYLAHPQNWRPERRQLHDRLIGDAKTAAQDFAEVIERGGHPPTLFALRGNTAAGKTRMATQTIPVLANALKESGGAGCINPDIFKRSLAETPEGAKLTSAQVHAESCILADRLEDELRLQKTASGAAISMLVDKRLAGAHEIDAYIKLAQETGRKIELCDIDAPLEQSLMGVLQRKPEGDAPGHPTLRLPTDSRRFAGTGSMSSTSFSRTRPWGAIIYSALPGMAARRWLPASSTAN